MRLFMRTAVTAAALWFVTVLPLDVAVKGGDGSWWSRVLVFLLVGLILVVINSLVKPIVKLLALPVMVLTLGLFTLVINWAMLWLASWLSSQWNVAVLEIGGFWMTLLAALVISIVTLVLGAAAGAKVR